MSNTTSKTVSDQDLDRSFSQSDRERYAKYLSTAEEKLVIAKASMSSNESTLAITKHVHNLHTVVRALIMDVGDFWYENSFNSKQRITSVLADFADDESVLAIAITDPNLTIGAEGFAVHADGSPHEGYRTPIYEPNKNGEANVDGSTTTLVGYKPVSSYNDIQVVYMSADVGNGVNDVVQEIFNRAKLRGIKVSQLDCKRLDGSVVTFTIAIDYDESVGYYKGLTVHSDGIKLEGLSHTMYNLIDLAGLYGVDMDIGRLEDRVYMRKVTLAIKDKIKADKQVRYTDLSIQAMCCLIERQ